MRIDLLGAAVGDGPAAEVPSLTLAIAAGAPVVIAVETDERPKLVSLLLGGHLRPSAGEILVDGRADAAALRRGIALVDTPFASEPTPGVALRAAVAEELAFAGRRTGRRAVAEVLDRHGLADAAARPVASLPAAERIRLLVDLALLRPGVRALVVTSPERHGGDPRGWFPALAAIAAGGTAVAVVTDLPTAALLDTLGGIRTAPDPEPIPEPDTDPARTPDANPAPAPDTAAGTEPPASDASPDTHPDPQDPR
ncbi:MAG: hypothetical protein HY996_10570 [Micrococcales bacterium]|nr:hypothetical protein [Micrococcales bacterium]